MNAKLSLKGDLRFLLSTRGRDGRYGPQSRDMSLSELIDIFTPEPQAIQSPSVLIFPDFSALANKMDSQIREHFSRFRGEELAQAYDVLFNTWAQTGSIADATSRSRRWEKVMDKSMEYILLAQKRMPEPQRFFKMQSTYVTEVSTKGKMYCEALLFHIIARSAFDPGSLANDITLRGYCQWFKDWVKNYIQDYDYEQLLFSAAMTQQVLCPVLQYLAGEAVPRDAGTYLVDKLKSYGKDDYTRESHWNQDPDWPVEYSCTLKFHVFSNVCWEMVNVLRDLHYRISRIEVFLGVLEEKGSNVDFTRTNETSAIMEAYLAQIEGGTPQTS